jgi:hypothetical protein
MQVEASQGALLLRFGSRFAAGEAQRLEEAIVAFTPLTQLTLDFSEVRQFEDAAFVPLARALGSVGQIEIRLRGLTLHQARMLRYFGVGPAVAQA